MKTEQPECSETSAYKIQSPGNYPEESIQQRYIYLNFNVRKLSAACELSAICHNVTEAYPRRLEAWGTELRISRVDITSDLKSELLQMI